MPEFRSRFPVLGSPNPSYPALCRQATSYAWRNRLRRIPLGKSEDARGEVRKGSARHSVAALGGQNPSGAGLPGIPSPAWRLRWPEARPKRRDGRDRRGAPYVTHSAFWRTGAQNAKENLTHFEHQQKEQMLVTNQGAKYITHSDVS